jgi:hypothetical protein
VLTCYEDEQSWRIKISMHDRVDERQIEHAAAVGDFWGNTASHRQSWLVMPL